MHSPTDISKKTAFHAMSAAVLFTLSWLESVVPLGIPGVKFGFSNLVILIYLSLFGFRPALWMTALKIALSALVFQGASSLLFTAGGSVASCVMMALFIGKKNFSLTGVSAVGGFCHITAQYVIAALTLYSHAVFSLYGIAVLTTLFTSVIIGEIAMLLHHRIKYFYHR